MMTRKVSFIVAAAVLALPVSGQAAQIGVGDFTSPTTVSFGNPGAPGTFQTVPSGLAIAPVTFTTADSSSLRWWGAGTSFLDCVGGCVTSNSFAAGTISAALSQPYSMVGLYVGQAGPFSLAVSFFDTANILLGTVNVFGPSDGVAFAGWENGGSAIGRVDVTNAANNGLVLAVQSGLFQNAAVPEPATWMMMLAGFGMIGAAIRRRGTVRLSYS